MSPRNRSTRSDRTVCFFRKTIHDLHHAQNWGQDFHEGHSSARLARPSGATIKTRMFYARKELATLLANAGIDRAGCELRQRGASGAPRRSLATSG
jgi:hypothetical protein